MEGNEQEGEVTGEPQNTVGANQSRVRRTGGEGERVHESGRRERKLAAAEEGRTGGVVSGLEVEVRGSGVQGDQKR